jgi:hypothetical protein
VQEILKSVHGRPVVGAAQQICLILLTIYPEKSWHGVCI